MRKSGFLVIIFWVVLVFPLYVDGAFLYKSYTVRYDRGWDILCDPYVVQKNDWVLKIFKQRGEIAHEDFPEFLRIFKRINPHIQDIDRVRPGQAVMIPLRKLKQGTLPGQSSGIVTIPFVTISSAPEAVKTHSVSYEVQKGDCVSVIIARRFGAFGSAAYREGIKLFKLVNPEVEDLDLIYAGQMVHVPDPALRDQPWYPSLFGQADGAGAGGGFDRSMQPEPETTPPPGATDSEDPSASPMMRVAAILNAKFLNKGKLYFPRPGQDDFEIDLSQLPMLELKDGTRVVFLSDEDPYEAEVKMITSFWDDVKVVRVPSEASTEQVFNSIFDSLAVGSINDGLSFSDQGITVESRGKWIIKEPSATNENARKVCISLIESPGQRTPESIRRYLEQHDIIVKDVLTGQGSNTTLKQPSAPSIDEVVTINPSDRRSMVKDFIMAMGYQYAPNVSISFPYAGMQIKAVSNLVAKPNHRPLLIDFGDFYGESLSAIKESGFDIIQIKSEDNFATIIQTLLSALGLSYSNNPKFLAADRPVIYNTNLTIPGFLIDDGKGSKVLFSGVPLHDGIIELLKDQGIKIIMFGMAGIYS